MNRSYVIAMDVHSHSTHVIVTTPTGRLRDQRGLPTTVPDLRRIVQATPHPRAVVFEEGPLAGWLYRNLQADADQVVVAETRRNAYVARDGDKSDPIDAGKLGQLYRSGFIRPVHHATHARRASFKDLVLFYHRRVSLRVAAANRVIWAVRAHGLVITEKHFASEADRRQVLGELPADRMLRFRVQALLADYDLMVAHEQRCEVQLTRRARKVVMIRRLQELPGISWIRAATFYALIDTPFRFRSKSALWRYMGIGLQRRSSGKGREQVRVPIECNRLLKNVILGAAQTAATRCESNPFSEQYRRCLERGQTPSLARRTVARRLASVMWGMFKSNTTYRPDWVGIPSGQLGRIA